MTGQFPFDNFIQTGNNTSHSDNHIDQIRQTPVSIHNTQNQEIPLSGVNASRNSSLQISEDQEENALLTEEFLNILQNYLSPEKYEAYFKNSFQIQNFSGNTIEISVTTSFIARVLTRNYLQILKNAAVELLGRPYEFDIKPLQATQPNGVPNQTFGPETLLSQEFSSSGGQSNLLPETDPRSLNSVNESYSTRPQRAHNQQQQRNEQANFSIGSAEHSQQNQPYQIKKARTVKDTIFTISEFEDKYSETPEDRLTTTIENRKQNQSEGQAVDSKKVFENFIVGPSNNLAHAACVAVSNNPGQVYSSLYIHGNSGLGKTHLLHAVANQILEKFPQYKIFITTANEFMSEMINAIQAQDIQSFRRKYSQQIDVLMIDDIHELKNKPGTQNEFFHVFNELRQRKKQLIFTSDKEPKEIHGIEDRIRTRLSSALVLEVQQPDLETRIAILKRKAREEDIFLPDDVVNLIASCIKSNIRELEGSLIKLGAYSSVFNVDIDLDTAKEQLKLNPETETKTVNLETISEAVSEYFKVPIPDLRSKSRNKEVTLARHVAMYFSYFIAKATLSDIGEHFGKRDHTSVMHAINKVRQKTRKDKDFSNQLFELETIIG